MDQETLANHIRTLGKRDFDIACQFVLNEIFSLVSVNVDGRNDGGTDFTAFNADGSRTLCAYQITTQKTDIKNKAYKDAKKAIAKLKVKRYFFMTTYPLSESEVRNLENTITDELDISASVYTPQTIAGLIIDGRHTNNFLDKIGFPELRSFTSIVDYREMALHGYTILSQDAKNLKSRVYDDSLIIALYRETDGLSKDALVDRVMDALGINPSKRDLLYHRIDALLMAQKIKKEEDVLILAEDTNMDVLARQKIYERELNTLVAAQADLLREYKIEWTQEDSRLAATWIANAYIEKQLSNLAYAKTNIVSHILKKADCNGIEHLKHYLYKEKSISDHDTLNNIVKSLIEMAATHPLIRKLTLASVYLALEGTKPITAVKALGAQRWCDINILIEPTIAIPYICSCLFEGVKVNKFFDNGIDSITTAQKLNMSINIPYCYIKECAGHLLMARKFDGIELDPTEMQYSSNAFVANYYACKLQGQKLPPTFMDYLALFSPDIRVERKDFQSWIRVIMHSIQSILTKHGVNYVDMRNFDEDEQKPLETEFTYYLEEHRTTKPDHLIHNDIYALLYVNEQVSRYGEHWMLLSFDNSVISVAQKSNNCAWVNNPFQFLDMVEVSNELPANKFHTLIHSMAQYSDQTLEIGARMFDRIIQFAADKMQEWEFRNEVNTFKRDLIKRVSKDNNDYMLEVDKRTDDFLRRQGINISPIDTETDIS